MFDTVFGLPMHPLVVHGAVVFLPLAALAVTVAAFWPRFRRWAGPTPLILSVIAAVLVPVATQSGEALANAGAGGSALVATHAELGDAMIYWAGFLLVAAVLVYWLHLKTRAADSNRAPGQAIVVGIIVLAVAASAGTLVHVFRVGDSGARAVWEGTDFTGQG